MTPVCLAVIQSSALPYDKAKLEYYLTLAKGRGVQGIVLGEYLLNLFFHQLLTTPLSMIAEQSHKQIENLTTLANIYKISIVAPLIVVRRDKPYKMIYIFEEGRVRGWEQQILMPYDHWNEAGYFANKQGPLKAPPVVSIGGMRLALMMGFEAHFPALWTLAKAKRAEGVLVPSASTFESQQRWRELFKTMAFLHGLYVLRANRVGDYTEGEHRWSFYGDSFLVNPYGRVDEELGEGEEMMIIDLDRQSVRRARRDWGFDAVMQRQGGPHV